ADVDHAAPPILEEVHARGGGQLGCAGLECAHGRLLSTPRGSRARVAARRARGRRAASTARCRARRDPALVLVANGRAGGRTRAAGTDRLRGECRAPSGAGSENGRMDKVIEAIEQGRAAIAISGSLLRDPEVMLALSNRAALSPMALAGPAVA